MLRAHRFDPTVHVDADFPARFSIGGGAEVIVDVVNPVLVTVEMTGELEVSVSVEIVKVTTVVAVEAVILFELFSIRIQEKGKLTHVRVFLPAIDVTVIVFCMVLTDVGSVDVRAGRGKLEEQKLSASGSPTIADTMRPMLPVQVDALTKLKEENSRLLKTSV